MLRRVEEYTNPVSIVHRVCDHLEQIITSQKQITELQAQQFLPPQCDHTKIETTIQILPTELDRARKTTQAPGTDEERQEELAVMTRDAQQSGEEVPSLRIQLANGHMSAARAAPAACQVPEDGDQKFHHSPVISGSDQSQFRRWIAQLRLVIRHKPASFPNEESKMPYAF